MSPQNPSGGSLSRPSRKGHGRESKGDGVSWHELSEAQYLAVMGILQKVRTEHGARMTFLADASGRPLADCGADPTTDLDGLASLCASAVAAATRLAEMLGEPGAGLVLQRGDRDVLFLESLGNRVVAVVLDAIHPRGLERVRAKLRLKRALMEMSEVLSVPSSSPEFAPLEDPELEAFLGPIKSSSK